MSKIILHSSTLNISESDLLKLLPVWLNGLPIREDVDEMEVTYGLLLDIIARDHPFVAVEHEEVRNQVLEAFAAALSNANIPPQLLEPLSGGFQTYLLRCPMETQRAWAARLAK